MKLFISTFIFFIVTFCYGQGKKLIPLDSSNFLIIADTLVDIYKDLSANSPLKVKVEPERLKYFPCDVDSKQGLITYRSSSFKFASNKCFYIFKNNSEFFIKVGRMTEKKDSVGEYIWIFNTQPINESTATKVINEIKNAISEAELPKYESFRDIPIVEDGDSYFFCDIQNMKYATAPIFDYTESVKKVIKLSQRLTSRRIIIK